MRKAEGKELILMEQLQPEELEELAQELKEEDGACRFEQRRAYGQQI